MVTDLKLLLIKGVKPRQKVSFLANLPYFGTFGIDARGFSGVHQNLVYIKNGNLVYISKGI